MSTGATRWRIDAYLAELARDLVLPRRLRRRVLAEVEGHLRDAAEALQPSCGSVAAAEREAVARFGPPQALARQFVGQVATRSAHRATDAVALALAALCVVGMPFVPLNAPGAALLSLGVVVGVAVQVAAVAGGLSLLRSLRRRPIAAISQSELRLLLRGNATALAAMLAGAATLSAAVLRDVQHVRASPVVSLFLAALAAVWPLTVLAAVAVGRALGIHRRAARLLAAPGGTAAGAAGGDVLDDLVGLGAITESWLERTLPWLLPAVRRGCGLAAALWRLAARRLPWAPVWLNLRRHPWRFCVSVAAAAVAASAALSVAGAISEGARPSPQDALAGAALEGVAVVLGFALLGRFLGIRRPARAAGDDGRRQR
jgi:hypothetical protein